MVPSVWVTRRSLPLLPSGKIDRAALPALALERTHAMPDAVPTTHVGTAAVIATVWESLLGWGSIGADDNFFAIGGHSLLAAKAVSRIGAALGVDLELRAIFEAPTIAALAQRIESTKCDASRATAAIPRARISSSTVRMMRAYHARSLTMRLQRTAATGPACATTRRNP